jgi:hypothetical protein
MGTLLFTIRNLYAADDQFFSIYWLTNQGGRDEAHCGAGLCCECLLQRETSV